MVFTIKSYIVVFNCPSIIIETRARVFQIDEGIYAYVGSCGRNCCARISRHYSTDKKNYWHIDYLSNKCKIMGFVLLAETERKIAQIMSYKLEYIKGFGSSDDKTAPSHLFRVDSAKFEELLLNLPVVVHFKTENRDEALSLCREYLPNRDFKLPRRKGLSEG